MKIDNGLAEKDRKEITENLSKILADTYILYLKTQNFHWNVTGPLFYSLHLLFEKQYNELAEAVDTLAERIRALGHTTPASFAQFTKLSTLKECTVAVTSSDEMLRQLLADHEALVKNIRTAMSSIEKTLDEATVDMLIQRLEEHEKTAWMLRSSLG